MPNEDVVVTVIQDAIKKHHVELENPLGPNIQALVSYAMTVGYHMGWKEWRDRLTVPCPQCQDMYDKNMSYCGNCGFHLAATFHSTK